MPSSFTSTFVYVVRCYLLLWLGDLCESHLSVHVRTQLWHSAYIHTQSHIHLHTQAGIPRIAHKRRSYHHTLSHLSYRLGSIASHKECLRKQHKQGQTEASERSPTAGQHCQAPGFSCQPQPAAVKSKCVRISSLHRRQHGASRVTGEEQPGGSASLGSCGQHSAAADKHSARWEALKLTQQPSKQDGAMQAYAHHPTAVAPGPDVTEPVRPFHKLPCLQALHWDAQMTGRSLSCYRTSSGKHTERKPSPGTQPSPGKHRYNPLGKG